MQFSKYIFLFLFLCVGVNLLSQDHIFINELVAKNKTSYLDEEGEDSDWIELFNPTNESVDLQGYAISDDNTKWPFPKITIAANDFLVIFASDRNITTGQNLHTNFKLSSDGELITLYDNSDQQIDEVEYPKLKEDESFGRTINENNLWQVFATPTPNQVNKLSTVAEELISFSSSHQSGFYPYGIEISYPSLDDGQSIYYTLDGSMPNPNSHKYKNGERITLEQTVDKTIAYISTSEDFETPDEDFPTAAIVRAAVFEGDARVSEVLNQTFWLTENPHTLPLVSLVGEERDFFDDNTGIYVKGKQENYFQKGDDWERSIHVSFFNQRGKLFLDQAAGIRLGGAKTRLEPQKTMRLYARSEYGKRTFDYPFWGTDYGSSFKRITLRTLNIGPWSKAGIQDDLIHEIINGKVNTDYVKRHFAVVYLNGVYWGIHSMREHNNQHFVDRKYGIDEDDVTIARASVNAGDTLNFDRLAQDIQFMDLTNDSEFEEVAARLDVEQYTDYMISNIAFANRDWPQNNVEYWYAPNFENGKIRFIINDLDAAMTVYNDERLEIFIPEQAVRLERDKWFGNIIFLQKLLEVPTYRAFFNNRLNEILHTTFAPSRTVPILQIMVSDLEEEMETHIRRWHHPNNINQWRTAVDRLEEFLLRRPAYLTSRSNELFGFPMEAYPNPMQDQFFLEFDAWTEGNMEICLFDIAGKCILQQSRTIQEGNQKIEIQTPAVAAGAYILVAQFQNLTVNEMLIKM